VIVLPGSVYERLGGGVSGIEMLLRKCRRSQGQSHCYVADLLY
jgi:hypothetical protein